FVETQTGDQLNKVAPMFSAAAFVFTGDNELDVGLPFDYLPRGVNKIVITLHRREFTDGADSPARPVPSAWIGRPRQPVDIGAIGNDADLLRGENLPPPESLGDGSGNGNPARGAAQRQTMHPPQGKEHMARQN